LNNLRLWIVILALVAFIAGGATGWLIAAGGRRPVASHGAFSDYQQKLVETFQLSEERAQLLRVVLSNYEKDIAEIKDRHMADITSGMEPELSEKGRYYRDLIHDKVLPENKRPEFDALALGIPWAPAHP
jgi:uncharacterized membrane-anchored protein YhcB (DUF1043 family)